MKLTGFFASVYLIFMIVLGSAACVGTKESVGPPGPQGPAGPTGPAGPALSGLEIVRKEGTSDSKTFKGESVECPTPKVAVGGGADLSGFVDRVAIVGTLPSFAGSGVPTGWTAFAREINPEPENWRIHVYVLCVDPG